MKDEEKFETKKIRKAIITGFDKYAKRYNERFFARLKSAPSEEKKQLMQTYKKVDSLLSKRVFIPGFYLYVLQKVIGNKQLMRQRTTFIKASLISIFNQEGVKVGDIVEKPIQEQFLGSRELPEAYTRRHTQRFFYDYWQDAFFKMNDSLNTRIVDDRFTPFSSVFASSEPPRTETSDIADQVLSASAMSTLSNGYLQEWIQSNSALEFILPDFLDDMRSFMKECKIVIAQEKKRLPKAYSRFISSELNSFSPLFETFYKHVTSIFAWKWFLLQNPEYRQLMLDEAFPLDYSESDATKAREILLSLTSERETKFFLSTGAIELIERARVRASYGIKAAVALFKECLKISDLSTLDQAILFENIAIAYRGTENYKLMVSNLKKALELYEKAGDTYRVCVALKNMGEAEWYFGFREQASEFFKKSEDLSNNLDPIKHSDVFWNLACAFRRIGDEKIERKYLEKCLALLPLTEAQRSYQVEERLLELTL